ncbi:MAG: threonylcarbamoyl-AMP synthase [Candidatus Obscuribacterales bacterium]|nr:threonylcarbamoyl-AMP synthase [Candidatus Obscuribacterales bacterium]
MNDFSIDQKEIERACEFLRAGQLVAFPTETVYGLGADAGNAEAIAKLYKVKGRPGNHPVIVHLNDLAAVENWAYLSKEARLLGETFWPGPLTLILPRKAQVSTLLTGGQDTVGVRIPSHPTALALLSAFGSGVAAPSANKFGKLSPTTAAAVKAGLGGEVAMVLDGIAPDIGIESTIVSLVGEPAILRPGMLLPEDIAAVCGLELKLAYLKSEGESISETVVKAPGTLDSHYAPERPLILVERGNLAEVLHDLGNRGLTCNLLAFADSRGLIEAVEQEFGAKRPVSRSLFVERQASDYARGLYGNLRQLDQVAAACIVVEEPSGASAWHGVRDRLRRAGHGSSLQSLFLSV